MEAIDNYYARAKNHLTNGMALQALDILDNHLTGNPSDPQALELHGIVFRITQRVEIAISQKIHRTSKQCAHCNMSGFF